MSDETIRVPDLSSGGKPIDAGSIERGDGTIVDRERVSIGDAQAGDADMGLLLTVSGEQGRGAAHVGGDKIDRMLTLLASIDDKLTQLLLFTMK